MWLYTLVSATFGHLDSTVVKIEPMVKNEHGGRVSYCFCLRRELHLVLIFLVLVKVTFSYWKLSIQHFMNLYLDCRLCTAYVE